MNERLYAFIGGSTGPWVVTGIEGVLGESLPHVARLAILNNPPDLTPQASWVLRGVTSNERYVTGAEKNSLAAIQPPLGRNESICGSLIPIRKTPGWWALPQDERRAILEERSHHVALGLSRLPAIARRLHHSRDLGEAFDFLTWFEYAPESAAAFESLVAEMRQTEEWRYIDREVHIRVQRTGTA